MCAACVHEQPRINSSYSLPSPPPTSSPPTPYIISLCLRGFWTVVSLPTSSRGLRIVFISNVKRRRSFENIPGAADTHLRALCNHPQLHYPQLTPATMTEKGRLAFVSSSSALRLFSLRILHRRCHPSSINRREVSEICWIINNSAGHVVVEGEVFSSL